MSTVLSLHVLSYVSILQFFKLGDIFRKKPMFAHSINIHLIWKSSNVLPNYQIKSSPIFLHKQCYCAYSYNCVASVVVSYLCKYDIKGCGITKTCKPTNSLCA